MKQPMVVTNLRMPQAEYLSVKAMAGELGMSVNEYVSVILKVTGRQRMMKRDISQAIMKERQSIFTALEKISKIRGKPMGWSKEDEEIYSV